MTIDLQLIGEREPSKISPMSANLLGLLTKDEVLDRLADVLSGGELKHELFKE